MAPQTIIDLVEAFERNLESYLSPQYKEASARQEFINPLFEALGWDVQNTLKYAENYKGVVHEPSLEEEFGSRAPDYSFQPAGQLKFYVEAKKPAVNLDRDAAPAHQLRMYGWTKQLALSILTNFAEFAVYDCRVEPKASDNPAVARLHYFSFREYPQRWDELVSLFSPDAIFKGSFDRFAESRKRRGAAPFDQRFLDDMEDWRKRLAENIAVRNPKLSQRDLNYAVQQTIDRTIFLRICEARGIEPFGRLRQLADLPDIYPHLVEYFRAADDAYNSGLFHFRRERGREEPDNLTPGLHIDDVVLKHIIKQLYWPARPYAFEVVPAYILGQVYERFLGKVIHLTPGHRARVEDKPEVKKAGGVYYTPAYIVDYIVKSTVGRLLDGKTWKQAAKFRVLDPACGSGSFLLGAYDYLLNWYRDQYVHDGPEKHKKQLYQTPAGYKLAIREKKAILLRHIYGVDIDPQAVEVTKLSLLLKVLEGESEQSVKPRLIKEPALPDLDKNIKCGNSLISPEFYELMKMRVMDEEEKQRINVFNWHAEFPTVMSSGGFEAVVGNPPYVRIQTTHANDLDYYPARYESAVGNYDIYCLFVERGLQCLSRNGRLGFILPHRFFKTDYGEGLRRVITRRAGLQEIVDFDGYMVFENASINTCILVLSAERSGEVNFAKAKFTDIRKEEITSVLVEPLRDSNCRFEVGTIDVSHLSEAPWVFIRRAEEPLWHKLESVGSRLRDVAIDIFQGFKTGGDAIYTAEVVRDTGRLWRVRFLAEDRERLVEPELMRRLIKGGEMKRFAIAPTRRAILFPYEAGRLVSQRMMATEYPHAWEYLRSQKSNLESRERGKMRGEGWYAYTRSQALTAMPRPKIVVPDYYAHASFGLDLAGEYSFSGGGAGGYGIVLKEGVEPRYVVALLNSRLLDWYLQKITVRAYQTAYMYVKKYIEQLPIKLSEGRSHSSLVGHVDTMLRLFSQSFSASTPHERTSVQRQIEATDEEIDRLVYQLYGLTNDEIAIVEGSVQAPAAAAQHA
jgi:type I restriction-modification system DNA methylase subunit